MNRSNWNDIWVYFKDLAKREKGTVINLLGLIITEAILPYISIVGMGFLLNKIYQGADMGTLFQYALAILLTTLLFTVLHARLTENSRRARDNSVDLESGEMNRKSLSMDYEYLEDPHVQELRSWALSRSNFGIRGWFLFFAQSTLANLLSVFTALVVLFPMFFGEEKIGNGKGSFFISLGLCAAILFMVWGNYKASIYFVEKAGNVYGQMEGLFNKRRYFMNMFSGVESQKDLRMNRQQDIIDHEIHHTYGKLQKQQLKGNHFYINGLLTGVALSDISCFLVYVFIVIHAYMGLIPIGNVVVYAASIVQLTNAVTEFAETIGRIKELSTFTKNYMEFIHLGNRKYNGTLPVEKRQDNRFHVSFEHVSFRYPGTDRDVIKDLDISFEIGEKMAIVGKNGSGKTTFIKLLCRLYDVTEGCIKINGIDIRKYNYEEYCRLFSVVFQDFCMFAFPLGEDIASSGSPEEGRVVDALEKAGLKERLGALEQGLATYVGKDFHESGISFSGGEKQKMAIARAIYKDAPFIIMDEPTAALDPLAECQVYAGFDEMVGAKTALYFSTGWLPAGSARIFWFLIRVGSYSGVTMNS